MMYSYGNHPENSARWPVTGDRDPKARDARPTRASPHRGDVSMDFPPQADGHEPEASDSSDGTPPRPASSTSTVVTGSAPPVGAEPGGPGPGCEPPQCESQSGAVTGATSLHMPGDPDAAGERSQCAGDQSRAGTNGTLPDPAHVPAPDGTGSVDQQVAGQERAPGLALTTAGSASTSALGLTDQTTRPGDAERTRASGDWKLAQLVEGLSGKLSRFLEWSSSADRNDKSANQSPPSPPPASAPFAGADPERSLLLVIIGFIDRQRATQKRLRREIRKHGCSGHHLLVAELRNVLVGIEAAIADAEGSLSDLGVQRYETPDSRFDTASQECLATTPCCDDRTGLVAKRLRPGYRRLGVPIRRELVRVYVRDKLVKGE